MGGGCLLGSCGWRVHFSVAFMRFAGAFLVFCEVLCEGGINGRSVEMGSIACGFLSAKVDL